MTRSIVGAALTTLIVAADMSPLAAVDRASAADAKALLEKAAAHYKAVGRKQALADFTAKKPPFVDRDLYVVCLGPKGIITANGFLANAVGMSADMLRDASGRPGRQHHLGHRVHERLGRHRVPDDQPAPRTSLHERPPGARDSPRSSSRASKVCRGTDCRKVGFRRALLHRRFRSALSLQNEIARASALLAQGSANRSCWARVLRARLRPPQHDRRSRPSQSLFG